MIEPVLHKLWQFETRDENIQNLHAFLMYCIVEPVFLAYTGLRVNANQNFAKTVGFCSAGHIHKKAWGENEGEYQYLENGGEHYSYSNN